MLLDKEGAKYGEKCLTNETGGLILEEKMDYVRRKPITQGEKPMKVTISDVAKLAGVSTATVSHTINNTRYVSSETKEKVYRAISELGYTPDASARSFRTGKKKTVGFIVPDIANKFFATMIESVETCLAAHGYHLIIANTKEDMDREENNIRLLSAAPAPWMISSGSIPSFPPAFRWCWWTGPLM